jgi:hypothetical protein
MPPFKSLSSHVVPAHMVSFTAIQLGLVAFR